jgi:hypothetical protein
MRDILLFNCLSYFLSLSEEEVWRITLLYSVVISFQNVLPIMDCVAQNFVQLKALASSLGIHGKATSVDTRAWSTATTPDIQQWTPCSVYGSNETLARREVYEILKLFFVKPPPYADSVHATPAPPSHPPQPSHSTSPSSQPPHPAPRSYPFASPSY